MDLHVYAFVFAATFVVISLAIPLARRLGWVDEPGGRKTHRVRTPVIGGLCVAVGVLPSVALIAPAIPELRVYLLASLLVLSVGAWDDRRPVHVTVRFAAHTLAALLMALGAGLRVESLGPWSGWGSLDLGVLSVAFTVFVTVGLINAFNMLDGMDGVLGGTVLAMLGIMGFPMWQSGGHPVDLLPMLLGVALLAFLAHNFPFPGRRRARVFLGDAGSTWLGFTVAWIAVSLGQGEHALVQPFTIAWILALPVMDTVITMYRRAREGRSPFAPDHDHLHYVLRDRGLSERRTVLAIMGLTGLLGLIGLGLDMAGVPNFALAVLFIGAFFIYWGTLRRPDRGKVSLPGALFSGPVAQRARKSLMPRFAQAGAGLHWPPRIVAAAAHSRDRSIGRSRTDGRRTRSE